jgi:hypothetical protein
LLAQLPARPEPETQAPSSAQTLVQYDEEVVLAQRRALHEDVVSFYLSVLDQQHSQSALTYLEQAQLSWDPEIWLYQVIAEYQGLASVEKSAFHLQYHQDKQGPFNDVWVIEDVELQLLSRGVLV